MFLLSMSLPGKLSLGLSSRAGWSISTAWMGGNAWVCLSLCKWEAQRWSRIWTTMISHCCDFETLCPVGKIWTTEHNAETQTPWAFPPQDWLTWPRSLFREGASFCPCYLSRHDGSLMAYDMIREQFGASLPGWSSSRHMGAPKWPLSWRTVR